MNCEKCLAQLDDFLDGKLNPSESALLEAHLGNCDFCAGCQADFADILATCDEIRTTEIAPPNPQAMWLRISNIIECEQTALAAVEAKNTLVLQPANGFLQKSWKLSFQQMFAAVLGVAVITSLLTVIAVKNAANFQENIAGMKNGLLGGRQPETRNLELENRLKQQQLAIDYWNQRVEMRRKQWNKNLREAFDRNLNEINQVVADYQQQLQTNPEDKISEEMLDSALQDKMALLREFSEL